MAIPVTMYAFDPTGHFHEIPGMTVSTMGVLLNRWADMSPDYVINTHNVLDRDGSRRRVISVLYRGTVLDVFTMSMFPRRNVKHLLYPGMTSSTLVEILPNQEGTSTGQVRVKILSGDASGETWSVWEGRLSDTPQGS